ncbi:SNF2 domain-containing protein CLASSY 1-like [Malania oleifera]|uniref:SNF2 domain-containing protein CLASSY 1-like n=1 Tax=Malania oleifera TaxID=397392 RepID=UPI0025AEA5C5|nr:SNF2 domain-containing protein CLASSY 1-like [Malania oleifera]XP_057980608.1 SNF2 domain-containing protein CLASSY 1-like [Malania oleifera]XP_057980609.1 SNF2 domain-containing protein CLASSY 1-like [Malania oleifera]XP_057980610.1 SNF2 domain-containing protein CLASSY 1-like [Malania oleifera]XP_057980611.1 SNF2 domain-containing protein CLASSY 1-like [Malania oleifera]XP_057980612.1 SNF2 domain-containing protein CLASSY 1-like [Malania oleifera]XP_057980613.1 SNF2 domain-containing pro
MGKRHLYRSKHPFDEYPFEAFISGSWQIVELIRIKDGAMTLHFMDGGFMIAKKGPYSNLRVRSRKATLNDCTCFFRPGVDICALFTSQKTESSVEENLEPVWNDAKISSIERRPHESCCKCQFYINFYNIDDNLGTEKATVSKEISIVELDQISILQKLVRNPCENEHHRWNFSEDCSSMLRTKLILGKFSSDLSWLVVASALKHITFEVRSMQNKIVYQIVGGDLDECLVNSSKQLNAINFRVENGNSMPMVVPFSPADIFQVDPIREKREIGPSPFYDPTSVRRSKRRNVQPERYYSEGSLPESDVVLIRTMPYRTDKWKSDELPLVPLNQDEEHTDRKRVQSLKADSFENLLLCGNNMKSRVDQTEHQNQLAIVPLPDESAAVANEQDYFQPEPGGNHSGEIGDIVSKYIYISGSPRVHRKKISALEGMDNESKLERNSSNKKVRRRRDYSIRPRRERESSCDAKAYRKRTLNLSGYNDMIKTYMRNIESTIKKEQPNIIDQWKEFQSLNCSKTQHSTVMSSVEILEDKEENSETEMLWREMELSIASTYLFEDNEGSNVEVSAGIVQKSSKDRRQFCQHIYKLDEELGILCQVCGFVSAEIKEVLPPFVQCTSWITNDKKLHSEENSVHKPDEEQNMVEDEGFDFLSDSTFPESPMPEGKENVWALIPDLKMKLRFHQKKAFEFLWQNIAGSLEPALMESAAKKRGGCVVSHSPGAGKTLLIIAFLLSYLKLFPGKRPLVLAPKTTLYTWYKEIIKWEVPIPVYQIHGCRTYRYEICNQSAEDSLGDRKPGRDVMHVLDCLEKIRKWHSHPSILLMGYTSFLSLTRESSKFVHRKYMGEMLRESPGILILDEGHNPRSTKSRLRKALMKVKTDLRILLSGTLFQNNFGEYFNTLCLARPAFVNEVLRELDPNFKRNKKGLKQTQFAKENRARKFFIETIANKINSSIADDRMQGLNMLRSMTGGFIDVYEGVTSDSLPGLQCYTLLMKPTTIQQEILVKLQRIMAGYNGYPLELELLITLGSIHPWLIKTAACVNKFFSMEEVEELEQHKFELSKGSKVKFVVSLVHRSILKKEKVLIFCHNIAPMNLFLEIFEWLYGWRKNEEILVLQGELELFERGRVMDKFEDPGGSSKILLASISACAEGISLTAASRVILLDTEWNPSKRKQAIARAFRPGQERVVYVYQLLVTGTLEEDKYGRTTYKEWVSSMIFNEELVEDPSCWQAEKIEDDLLREIVEEDRAKSFHMIMKNEKTANALIRGKE